MENGSAKRRHPTNVDSSGKTNLELGEAIIGMRYDCVGDVMEGMLRGVRAEMRADYARGRIGLAFLLGKASCLLLALLCVFKRIFRLCRPHMADEMTS